MRLLVIGGTKFVGRHIVGAALARGDDVTLFHRGLTAPDLFQGEPRVDHVFGDRTVGFDALGRRTFDAVIDPSGYVPRVVDMSLRAFEGRAERYVFVSSISVYKDFARATSEDAPLATTDDPTTEDVTGKTYGPLKALCETLVTERFGPARATIVRPGVIAGAFDPTDRFTYWTRQISGAAPFVAPGDGSRLTQITDVRDLASFMLLAADGKAPGVFNVTGDFMPFRTFLRVISEGLGVKPHATWVPESELERLGIKSWTDLPLFIAGEDQRTGPVRARAAGLRTRNLVDTARFVDEWDRERGRPDLLTGLSTERIRDSLEYGKLDP